MYHVSAQGVDERMIKLMYIIIIIIFVKTLANKCLLIDCVSDWPLEWTTVGIALPYYWES